jgi:hypothetical protein
MMNENLPGPIEKIVTTNLFALILSIGLVILMALTCK